VHSLARSGGEAAALLAGLLFALHPVHTEAVVGVVGRADLLAAACVLAALRCREEAERSEGRRHARALAATLLCVAAACAAKDTGLTAVASLACIELLSHCRRAVEGARVDGAAAAAGPAASPAASAAAAAAAKARRPGRRGPAARGGEKAAVLSSPDSRAAVRLLSFALLALSYLALRHHLTGGAALSTNLRRVDNGIPYLETRQARLLSIANLHARNAHALLSPLAPLSADWSYDCIPAVTRLLDARNFGSAALYVVLSLLLVAARPWRPAAERALLPARERACVACALLLAPFAPASNLLVYPGTHLAERLLYLPSVGLVLLLAPPLARFAADRRAARAALALLLAACFCRTALRARDWRSEARLFDAALAVCPRSARMAVGHGIAAGRTGRYEEALQHFASARNITADYCDIHYYEGLSLINLGRLAEGEAALEAALDCTGFPRGAEAAAGMLLQRTEARLAESPEDIPALLLRARLLAEQGKLGVACSLVRRAQATSVGAGKKIRAAVARAVEARCALADATAADGSCEGAAAALQAALLAADAGDAGGVADGAASLRANSPEEAAASALAALRSARGGATRAYLASPRGASCLGSEPHARAVLDAHTAAPYDPYLQREWARVLLSGPEAARREAEAAQHGQLAQTLFGLAAQAGEASKTEAAELAREAEADWRPAARPARGGEL